VGLTLLVAARQMTAQQENLRLTTALVELATVDPLTGLHNRRSFFELAEGEWARTARSDAPLTALMLDVDFFKHINDRCGHSGHNHSQIMRRNMSHPLQSRFDVRNHCPPQVVLLGL
jgi:PleD family two-component response regulator